MCVMSMVMDHYHDKWKPLVEPATIPAPPPYLPWVAPVPMITPAEIEEFRRLLERARKYDAEHAQPDCEMEEKRQRLKDLAKELGVEIDFV